MGKKLYLTDLDGTLLNRESTVSCRSRDIINSLINSGLHDPAALNISIRLPVMFRSSLDIIIQLRFLFCSESQFFLLDQGYRSDYRFPVAVSDHDVFSRDTVDSR